MWGVILRLLATGQASRRLGDYARNLTVRYLILGLAVAVAAVAAGFASLASYWALSAWVKGPILAALIMAAILCCVALLIALAAYGTTRESRQSAEPVVREPVQAGEAFNPTVEDVGRGIENAVHRYGPLPVTAVAAAGGFVAALLAKRFSQPRVVYEYGPPLSRRDRRRNGRR
jgi:small-conductance mechanosensitive channel